MSILGAGQFQLNQSQQGLATAARTETDRNIANRNLHEQGESAKAGLGATVAGSAAGLAGFALGGPIGAAVGVGLGSIAGSFASKLF